MSRAPLKALEQESCEDAISRKAVIEAIYDIEMLKYRIDLEKVIKELPPVTLQRPKGKWIKGNYHIRCSECGEDYPYRLRNFCPNCGAKMVEPQERSENVT